MNKSNISKPTIGRVPLYIKYLRTLPTSLETISATIIARGLKLGEVQVRKDLGVLCGSGKPKVGYNTRELIEGLESYLEEGEGGTIIIGAGKLGRALLDFSGFADYGISVDAAFDKKFETVETSSKGKKMYPMSVLQNYCKQNNVTIGIIAVPGEAAQEVCDLLCENGIKGIMCFAPCTLKVPEGVTVQYENMALSLAHLKVKVS